MGPKSRKLISLHRNPVNEKVREANRKRQAHEEEARVKGFEPRPCGNCDSYMLRRDGNIFTCQFCGEEEPRRG